MIKSRCKVSVKDAARQLNIPPQAVRILMRRKKLPIGIAEKITGERYTYYISQQLINNYLGIKNEKTEGEEV